MALDRFDRSWTSGFVLSRTAISASERRELARRAEAGALRRIVRGVYSSAPASDRARGEDRHLELVRAHHLLSDQPLIFSHASAAAVWGLPRIGTWPDRVEVLDHPATGGRSQGGIRRRAVGIPPDYEVIQGIAVTGLARTIVDLACTDLTASAVASADSALRGIPLEGRPDIRVSKHALRSELDGIRPVRGSRGAEWVIDFADGAAQLPGESLSRVQMHRVGLRAPALQHRFVDSDGEMFVDFFWKDFDIVGEFDGHDKYLRIAPARGQTVAEAVLAEKRREDRLRRQVRGVVRWGWKRASDRAGLERLLRDAGVH